ncbi:hypothetical protein EV363DRAFT_1196894, partial [Boletus edulis]
EYIAMQDYATHHIFIHVVEELEGLVVQHLSELSKANLAGTGLYFITRYVNICISKQACTLPTTVLPETQLFGRHQLQCSLRLKVSHSEVLMKPWTQSINHKMAMKFFKVLWLKEDISHLNIEVQHLATWIGHDKK